MKKIKMELKIVIFASFILFCEYGVSSLSFPGPRVYVVTPSSRTLKNNEGKPAPFYYHKWIRRIDASPSTSTTSTTTPKTVAPKVKTPDLIFAEFESDGSKQKSIRKLLENEKILPKESTMRPIYVPDEEENKVTMMVNYGLPVKTNHNNENSTENVKYSFISHDDYYHNFPAPVFSTVPVVSSSTTRKFSTTTLSPIKIENIWHVIDSEKSNEHSNKWEEISFESKNQDNINEENLSVNDQNADNDKNHQLNFDENSYKQENSDDSIIDENFALPGFATNSGSGAENESRAIRTEQNIRFPYINLKPFQIKSSKNPSLNSLLNSKKSNLYTSLDNFYDLKNPVRGEAHDIVPSPQPVDRYNPAQPYLPKQKYGSNLSKQSSLTSSPPKATGSLVPPPPPPPKSIDNDFPVPKTYESFPPYVPSTSDFGSVEAPEPMPSPPTSLSVTPIKSLDISGDSETPSLSAGDSGSDMDISYHYKPPPVVGDSDSNGPIMSTGYHYKPPSMPTPNFYPISIPQSKPFQGYSYNKPSVTADTSPMMVDDMPEFQGYHYNKPSKPLVDNKPPSYGSLPAYGHDDSPPETYENDDSSLHSYGFEYPKVIYDYKPQDDIKGEDDMNDMGMKPPSLPSLNTDVKPDDYEPPTEDHGFPSDFPTDFKLPPDFDEHEHYHYHTTTTTEMPRVNRFSYYYLGKKLYYLPLYFSVYFIIYVGALIIKAVLRHKIVYPNSWRPNTTTATFFSKRSVDEYFSHENLHELSKKVTHAIATAADKYMRSKTGSN